MKLNHLLKVPRSVGVGGSELKIGYVWLYVLVTLSLRIEINNDNEYEIFWKISMLLVFNILI